MNGMRRVMLSLAGVGLLSGQSTLATPFRSLSDGLSATRNHVVQAQGGDAESVRKLKKWAKRPLAKGEAPNEVQICKVTRIPTPLPVVNLGSFNQICRKDGAPVPALTMISIEAADAVNAVQVIGPQGVCSSAEPVSLADAKERFTKTIERRLLAGCFKVLQEDRAYSGNTDLKGSLTLVPEAVANYLSVTRGQLVCGPAEFAEATTKK